MEGRSLQLPPAPALAPDAVAVLAWRRRALWLAWTGLGWHLVEGGLALAFGAAASSIALIAFGADSFIEAAAAVIILWRLIRGVGERAERLASRMIAGTFFLLAAYVAAESARTLVLGLEPDQSVPGIALTALTALLMPPLARAKERAAAGIGSAAARSEGRQNLVCAYLSLAVLGGLAANALLGLWWADPVAACVIAAVAVREGIESWRGEIDCC